MKYAELHCISNFTFLRGASHPEELVVQASQLGYRALAITDECSVSGVVRAYVQAKEHDLKLIIGSEFRLTDGPRVVLLAKNRKGYGQLCSLITKGRRAAPKGDYLLCCDDFRPERLSDCLALLIPDGADPDVEHLHWFKTCFENRGWIAVELLASGRDRETLLRLQVVSDVWRMPLVAAGEVHMHARSRRALQDTLTAIRLNTTVAAAAGHLYQNGERHLRSLARLKKIYSSELLVETERIAAACTFSLDTLRYEYPRELVPAGETPATHLRRLTEEGADKRWPGGVPDKVKRLIDHELKLIEELCYEPYFLTVHDIVRFAKGREILCQGRGSAANSCVCFCLGITEVDPSRMSMLFERFVSKERNEPPDIDVDFEHERREEVIQYIYQKYGRVRAALAATVITYRPRSAIRDVGKALGFDNLQIDRLARAMQWWDGNTIDNDRVRETGLDPQSAIVHRFLYLTRELLGFPRHLSQHVGGFVISEGPLSELVPVENTAMEERTVVQWDKDDLEDLGLMKVDVLGLGMLTAIRKSFDLLKNYRGQDYGLATVPAGDTAVYDMICKADTVGVFQIESRAQMAMLPRLKPRCYYDLVIEVAIVRPGPIQGDMVHPYLRRRNGEESVSYPSDAVKQVLERTLGVPIFQEQVMQLAVVAAGFTPGEADRLRRSMAAWRKRGDLNAFEPRLIDGMRERGYSEEFARRIFSQIRGFGEYGFPESHSASFALLVYVSAWLKHHEPAAFFCALLNSQPMGFYAPSQLVQAARRDGVEVRPVRVNASEIASTLEAQENGEPALRLGFRVVRGLSETGAQRLVEARKEKTFKSVQDLAERTRLDRGDLGALAAADALTSIAGHRYRARWSVAGVETPTELFDRVVIQEAVPLLKKPTEGQDVVSDYASTGLTLRSHPLALLRRGFDQHVRSAEELWRLPNGTFVKTAGLVVTRQRPGSAGGVTFVTLEDETGQINLVVWQSIAQRQRRVLLGARMMFVSGTIQREGDVLHVIAGRLEDGSDLLGNLQTSTRDFH